MDKRKPSKAGTAIYLPFHKGKSHHLSPGRCRKKNDCGNAFQDFCLHLDYLLEKEILRIARNRNRHVENKQGDDG